MRNETDASFLGDTVASNIKRTGDRHNPCRNKKCDVRTMEVRSCNHCCSRKALSITYSECVSVVLVIQHANNMLRIILSSVDCLGLQYF